MTLPAAGTQFSWSQIQTEFGGTNPISISEYYAGGANVPAGTPGYPVSGGPFGAGYVAIPSSGQVAASNFRSSAKITTSTFDLQYGTRDSNTDISGVWFVPRIISGDVTITVIGGGTSGYGGPSYFWDRYLQICKSW